MLKAAILFAVGAVSIAVLAPSFLPNTATPPAAVTVLIPLSVALLVDNVANPQYQNCNGPSSVGAQVVKILICPSEIGGGHPWPVGTYGVYYFGLSSYGGCSGTSATTTTGTLSLKNGIFFMNSSTRMTDIKDGTSITLMFGERSRLNLPPTSTSESLGGWAWCNQYAQEDNTMNASVLMEGIALHDLNAFGSQHDGDGANFAFADASVRYLTPSIGIVTFQRLAAIADGRVINGGF